MARTDAELEFIGNHVVVRVGTSPVKYAIAKDNKDLTIVGPTRATPQRAWDAALKQVRMRHNPEREKTKLTKPQREAILELIQRIKIDGPNAHCAYGPGGTDITRTTATALRAMGLVDLHSEVSTRPAKAGFGNHANWKTVYTPNLWMTATPRFLEMLRGKKLIPRENTGRKNPRTRGDEYGIRTVSVENQTLYVERETRTNRRTGKTRTVGYNLYTAHPWNDPSAVLVGSADTLMNAAEHARHAMAVRPWVFKTPPVQRPA